MPDQMALFQNVEMLALGHFSFPTDHIDSKSINGSRFCGGAGSSFSLANHGGCSTKFCERAGRQAERNISLGKHRANWS